MSTCRALTTKSFYLTKHILPKGEINLRSVIWSVIVVEVLWSMKDFMDLMSTFWGGDVFCAERLLISWFWRIGKQIPVGKKEQEETRAIRNEARCHRKSRVRRNDIQVLQISSERATLIAGIEFLLGSVPSLLIQYSSLRLSSFSNSGRMNEKVLSCHLSPRLL